MKISELLPILKQVLTNPYVIGTAVVVILFMNFCSFVCNYKKRPPKGKKRNAKKAAPQQPKEQAENSESSSQSAGEDGKSSGEK